MLFCVSLLKDSRIQRIQVLMRERKLLMYCGAGHKSALISKDA